MQSNHSSSTGFESYNFGDCLVAAAIECPNKVAFIFQEGTARKSITYRELHLRALNVSVELRTMLTVGDRALLVYPPGLDYIIGFMGCLYAGVIAVPVYPPATASAAQKLRTIVEDCIPAIILTDSTTNRRLSQLKFAGMVASIPLAGRLISSLMRVSTSELDTMNSSLALDVPFLATDELPFYEERLLDSSIARNHQDSLAFLQYTSGSTGNPKGVMVSHNNLRHSTLQYGEKFSTAGKRIVSWLPPYHDLGLIGFILTPMYYQCETCLFSPLEFLRNPLKWMIALSEFKANISAAPNFAYGLVTKRYDEKKLAGLDLSAIDLLLVGAEPVKAHTMQQFIETYTQYGLNESNIIPGYGIAEGTLIITGRKKSDPLLRLNLLKSAYSAGNVLEAGPSEEGIPVVGCGPAFDGHEVIIVHPETFEKIAIGQVGEIWIKSESVAKGYWHKPDLTEQTFHAVTSAGQGPYLRTGDFGFMHEGQLFISGRLKDLIIIAGKNYYPQDIETMIDQSHEQIRPGCSVAISVELEDTESLVLLVELREGCEGYASWAFQEITQAITRQVLEHSGLMPAHIILLPAKALDKTTSGKVRRQPNKTRYLNGELTSLILYQQESARKASSASLAAIEPADFPMRTAIEVGLLAIVKEQLSLENLTSLDPISIGRTLTEADFPALSQQLKEFIESKAKEFGYQECLTQELKIDVILQKNSIADMLLYICCFFEMYTDIGKNILFAAIHKNNEAQVSKLISTKVRTVDFLGLHGKTGLHLAIQLNLPGIIALLLSFHANINHRTELGVTSLELAVFSQQIELVNALLTFSSEIDLSLLSLASDESVKKIVSDTLSARSLLNTTTVEADSSFSMSAVWASMFSVDNAVSAASSTLAFEK